MAPRSSPTYSFQRHIPIEAGYDVVVAGGGPGGCSAAICAAFFRKYVGGCEDIHLVATASLFGVRESRRIVGEYELNYDDFRERRSFPDQIAIYNKSVDIHVHDCSDEQ